MVFAAEDPTQSIHWLWPEPAEIIYGGLALLIVYFLLWKFALPPLKDMFRRRTERIEKDLDGAEQARRDAETAASDIRSRLGDIDAERARMLAEADEAAARMLEQGRERIAEEIADLEAKAAADIEKTAGRAAADVQAEVVSLAAAAADEIVRRRLDEGLQQHLVEQYIAKVGSAS